MYRKRNQLMEIAVCLADACAALFSLCVAGVLRYQTLEGLAQAEISGRFAASSWSPTWPRFTL